MSLDSRRLPGLDGLRALAVCCVVFSHTGASSHVPQWPVLDQARRVFSGQLGVQLFFTISGFIITFLLNKEQRKTGTISLKSFWMRRAVRILPPAGAYLLFLQFLNAAHLAPVPPQTQMASLLFYRNMMFYEPWFTTCQGFSGHYWSLSVEEQFYLLWPLLVSFLPMRTLVQVAWCAMVLSVGLRGLVPWLPEGSDRWLPMCLDGFMAGALAAMQFRDAGRTMWDRCWSKRWVLLCITLLLTRMASIGTDGWFWLAAAAKPVQPLLAALTSAVWITGLAKGAKGSAARLLNSWPLVQLGLISYSLYLWQQVWLAPSNQWFAGDSPAAGIFPQNLLTCLACGAGSYLLIERPCLRLRGWVMQQRGGGHAI